MFKCFRYSRVNRKTTIPAGNRFAAFIMQEPILVCIIKLLVARTKRSSPKSRTKTQLTYIIRKLFHTLRELFFIHLKIHVVKIPYRQLVGISLPGFDRPEFTSKGLEIFFSNSRFGKIILSSGFIKIG